MSIVPSNRPNVRRDDIENLLESLDEHSRVVYPAARGGTDYLVKARVFIVGIRGYYLDTMGEKGLNDRGIYDDALIIVSPHVFGAFNANTDPSIERQGIATIRPGVYPFRKGNHGISRPGGGYPAFRPATKNEELPVFRDGVKTPWNGVATNIHKGGYGTTSSEGCQTIFPDQWEAFRSLAYAEMDRYSQEIVPYVLVENHGGKLTF